MNTIDYFEFHHFPEYKKLYLWCAFGLILGVLGLKYLAIYFVPLAIYLIYVTATTSIILYTQTCKYRGYFLYPERFIRFFKIYKKELPLLSFDNVATLGEQNSHVIKTNKH